MRWAVRWRPANRKGGNGTAQSWEARVLAAACARPGEFAPRDLGLWPSEVALNALYRLCDQGLVECNHYGPMRWAYRTTDAGRARNGGQRVPPHTPALRD